MELFPLLNNFPQTGDEQVKLLFSALDLRERAKLAGQTHKHLIQGSERMKEFTGQTSSGAGLKPDTQDLNSLFLLGRE